MPGRSEKRQIPILMYHSISHDATTTYKAFNVPPPLFAAHMAHLYREGYTPLTVTQFIYIQSQETLSLPERSIILTFDDGFADFFTEALPILKQHSFTATLYVPTAFIGGTSTWMEDKAERVRPILTWEQLGEINASGIECAAHGHRHLQMDILPHVVARDELAQCKRLLEQHLNCPILSFAYPHGYYTTSIQRLIQETGYTSACAVKYAMSSTSDDAFALARLRMGEDISVSGLDALLTQHSRVPRILYTRPLVPLWRFMRYCSSLQGVGKEL